MSSPQPPEFSPGQGGGHNQQGDNPALADSGPTQAVQPGQGNTPEATQVVRPGQQQPGGSPSPFPEATQVVSPGQQNPNYGQYAAGVQPPAPGAPQQPGWSPGAQQQPPQPGYGQQQQPGYPQQMPGYPPAGPGQQSGYGQPVYGQQPGYGQQPAYPGYAPGGAATPMDTNKIISWVVLAVAAVMALLGAILTITLWSEASGGADPCAGLTGAEASACAQVTGSLAVPTAAIIYFILLIVGGVAGVAGAVLVFMKKEVGKLAIIGGGALLLLFSIIFMIQYTSVGRIVYDLIAGIVVAGIGALAFFPQTRAYLGLPGGLAAPGGYGQVGGFG